MPFIFNPLSGAFDYYQTSSGSSSNSFTIWQPDNGTSPTASSSSDTMDVTSSDASITITGNSSTKTLNFQLASGIALTKLAALNNSIVPVTSGSGFLTSSATTATELGYVHGVTSDLQTQLNGKQATGSYLTALTGEVSASGPGSASATLSNSAVIGKVLTGFSSGAGTVAATDTILQGFNKLVGNQALKAPLANPTFTGTIGTALTGSKVVVTDGSGNLSTSAVTPTTLAFLDVGSSLTTLLAAKAPLASPTFTGTIGTPLTANRMVITDASGNLAVQSLNNIPTVSPDLFLFDDFYTGNTVAYLGQLGWKSVTSGGSAGTAGNAIFAGHPGTLNLNTGTSAASNWMVCYLAPNVIDTVLTDGAIIWEALVNISNLSTGAQDYIIRCGLGDKQDGTAPLNGVYFEYNNDNSANWSGVTAKASAYTITDTTVVAAQTTWVKLMWISNAAGTSIDFYVNGVKKISAQNTNIPTLGFGPFFSITKSVGTTNRAYFIDYFRMQQILATPRT